MVEDSLNEEIYIKKYKIQSKQTYNTNTKVALKSESNISSYYDKSIDALIEYIKNNEINPSEVRWNKHAIQHDYLSSQSIGYLNGRGFNKLCKIIRKKIEKEKRSKI